MGNHNTDIQNNACEIKYQLWGNHNTDIQNNACET